MTAWQKRARLFVAIIGVAVVLAVLATVRGRGPADEADAVVRVDPKAVAEAAGGRLLLTKGTRVPEPIDFGRVLHYADGTAKLLEPVYTSERNGREVVVRSKEADVGADQTQVVMRGDVRLTESDGWTAETEEASFNRNEGVVRAPGRFSFEKGTIRGSSVGMTYDQHRDVLWLLDQAVVVVTPDATSPGAEITAGSAGYARRDGYMRFEGGVKMVREGRVIESESAMAFLSDDESRLEKLELRGNAHIATPESPDGGLRDMYARDMNLVYAGDGETLERATLAGGGFGHPTAFIQFAGVDGAAGRRLAGEHIDIQLGPDGEVTSVRARENVELSLPADGAAPARVIRAAAMDGRGEAGRGLTGSTFSGGVEFREGDSDGAAGRRARSRTLTVVMQPGSGAIDDARFGGGTRFEDGTLQASAVDGRYQIGKGQLELTGSEGAADPRVEDERITVQAKRIELTFEGPRLVATTEVRSELRPARRDGTTSGRDDARVPGMLADDQPVFVTGRQLRYDGSRSHAEYTGGARLWQGDTTIQGETIVLDERKGDLEADGGEKGMVRSAFVLEQTDEKTGKPSKVPSVASGRRFHYEDEHRRATYTTDAHVNGPQGDCHAVKIELYFSEAGGSLERAEAYERVRLTADARTASGDRMTYFAADERYVMLGTPVTIVEECRETTGKTLTFWRSTDRILVDGNEEIRTLTKSGGPCAQPR